MGGEGSIFSMITISKNNRKLLRKKSIFAKSAGRFDDPDKATFGPVHQELEIKHLSKEELKVYHDRTLRANRKAFISRLIITAIVLVILTGLAHLMSKEIARSAAHKKHIEFQERMDTFNRFMKEGDTKIKAQNWSEAIYNYTCARNIFPENKITQYKLLSAYSESCKYTGYYCLGGKRFAEELAKKYPGDETIQEFYKEFKLKIPDSDKR